MKPLILRLLGGTNAGRLDYLLRWKSKEAWGPFNGQTFRKRSYLEMMSRVGFRAIVETGTFRGTTTELFAESGLPVYSVEIDSRAYGYALQRFSRRRDKVHLFKGNSPEFLQHLASDPNVPKAKVFVYLDAHVQDSSHYHKAPLVEELEIIFTNWTEAVVMVDDFEVPETDYSFDNWGPGKTLSLECLTPLKHMDLGAFFPAIPARQETGFNGIKRGWVVLCRESNIRDLLAQIETLTLHVGNTKANS